MTHIATGLTAYANPQAAVRSGRSLEYEIFARLTRAMAKAWSGRKTDHAALVAAVADNIQLWTVLASDVASEQNGLPQALRARLFYLYEFTIVHSRQVLDGRATIDALVDVNTSVMRGLRGDGGS